MTKAVQFTPGTELSKFERATLVLLGKDPDTWEQPDVDWYASRQFTFSEWQKRLEEAIGELAK